MTNNTRVEAYPFCLSAVTRHASLRKGRGNGGSGQNHQGGGSGGGIDGVVTSGNGIITRKKCLLLHRYTTNYANRGYSKGL